MATVEASVVINRPLEEVFAFVSNPENDPQWASGILEAEQTSEGPIGVGATFRGVIHRMGQRIEWTSEITQYEPHSKVSLKSAGGPMRFEESMAFEPVEGGTRLSVVADGESEGFIKLADSILARMWQRQIEVDLANLKDLLAAQT